jgi:hypothetical protein
MKTTFAFNSIKSQSPVLRDVKVKPEKTPILFRFALSCVSPKLCYAFIMGRVTLCSVQVQPPPPPPQAENTESEYQRIKHTEYLEILPTQIIKHNYSLDISLIKL